MLSAGSLLCSENLCARREHEIRIYRRLRRLWRNHYFLSDGSESSLLNFDYVSATRWQRKCEGAINGCCGGDLLSRQSIGGTDRSSGKRALRRLHHPAHKELRRKVRRITHRSIHSGSSLARRCLSLRQTKRWRAKESDQADRVSECRCVEATYFHRVLLGNLRWSLLLARI